MNKKVDNSWINDTALLFYQIFSADFENEKFLKRLLTGGGGNSALCSTWTHFCDEFIKHRISKRAYNDLVSRLEESDKVLVSLEGNRVIMHSRLLDDKEAWFYDNAKTIDKRVEANKHYHFDHNPPNKCVLVMLKESVEKNKKNKNIFINDFAKKIKNIQTLDLITIEEDEKRMSADRKTSYTLSALERDKISNSTFYDLDIVKEKE